MSEQNQDLEVLESTPAPEPTKPTEAYIEIAKSFNEAAKAFSEGVGELKHMKELDAKRQEESSKMRSAAAEAGEFRAKSFDDLITKHSAKHDREVKEIHELNDASMDRAIARAYAKGIQLPLNRRGEIDLARLPEECFASDEYKALKAFREKAAGSFWDAGTSTPNWTPTQYSRTVQDFFTIDADIPALFDQVNIPDATGDFRVPVESTRARAIIIDERTAVTGDWVESTAASQAQALYATLSPKKHMNVHAISMEGVEDLVIDALNRARANSAKAVRQGISEAIINGQTASDDTLDDQPGTSGLYAADGYSNAGGDNGLRLHCTVNSLDNSLGGNLTGAEVLLRREGLVKYGARADDLALITSPKGYLGLLQDTNVLTVDKYGTGATILTGELARIAGVRIFVTSEFPENIAASGIDAGASETGITGAVLVNRTRWLFGSKRNLTTTLLPQPGVDILNVITTTRTHFVTKVADETNAWYIYNVT